MTKNGNRLKDKTPKHNLHKIQNRAILTPSTFGVVSGVPEG